MADILRGITPWTQRAEVSIASLSSDLMLLRLMNEMNGGAGRDAVSGRSVPVASDLDDGG